MSRDLQRRSHPLVSGAAVQRRSAGVPGKRSLTDGIVQRRDAGTTSTTEVHDAAARGVDSPTAAMPHAGAIQSSFGAEHDISGIAAHVGGGAAEACGDMGATAFASGDHVAFAEEPSLHTAAHEAAHVVQQAQGVNLEGGVGEAGDAFESHADAVADRVVAGESAAELLASGPAGNRSDGVQRKTARPAVVQRRIQYVSADLRSAGISSWDEMVMHFPALDGFDPLPAALFDQQGIVIRFGSAPKTYVLHIGSVGWTYNDVSIQEAYKQLSRFHDLSARPAQDSSATQEPSVLSGSDGARGRPSERLDLSKPLEPSASAHILRLTGGRFQWDTKGLGLSVQHDLVSTSGEVIPETNVTEIIHRTIEGDTYRLPVRVQGGMGDFHHIPHRYDSAEMAPQFVANQVWIDSEERTIPNSGYQIVKNIEKLGDTDTYSVTITKTPVAITVDGRSVSAGVGDAQSVTFKMVRKGDLWMKHT